MSALLPSATAIRKRPFYTEKWLKCGFGCPSLYNLSLFVCLWVGRGRAKGRLSLWLCQELLLMTPAFRGIDSSQAVLNGPGLGQSHAGHLSIIDPVPPHQLCSWCIPSPCINVRLGLEITLQALMPTPVQLSTVGQPLVQGNHKLHVIEVPYRLRAAHSKATFICWN